MTTLVLCLMLAAPGDLALCACSPCECCGGCCGACSAKTERAPTVTYHTAADRIAAALGLRLDMEGFGVRFVRLDGRDASEAEIWQWADGMQHHFGVERDKVTTGERVTVNGKPLVPEVKVEFRLPAKLEKALDDGVEKAAWLCALQGFIVPSLVYVPLILFLLIRRGKQ